MLNVKYKHLYSLANIHSWLRLYPHKSFNSDSVSSVTHQVKRRIIFIKEFFSPEGVKYRNISDKQRGGQLFGDLFDKWDKFL